jgi:hypothetical protein
MASEVTSSGKVFQTSGGRFGMALMYSNRGVNLASNVMFEAFLEHKAAIENMSAVVEGRARRGPKATRAV